MKTTWSKRTLSALAAGGLLALALMAGVSSSVAGPPASSPGEPFAAILDELGLILQRLDELEAKIDPPPAASGELYTPPLSGVGGGICTLVNVGPDPINVRIEVRGGAGNVLNGQDATADPGHVAVPAPVAYFQSTTGYCAFFFDGDPANVRAGYFETGPAPNFPLISVVRAE